MSWFVYVVTLAEDFQRDPVMQALEERGIPTRGYFSPVHLQPYVRQSLGTKEGMLPITESVAQRTIALPFQNHLTEQEVNYVVANLAEVLSATG